MKNKHYSFVILHYLTLYDTIKCVSSIKENCKSKNISIVIVDNASPNGSGKDLFEKYRCDDTVHVIINPKNLGFASGNNIGFKYAKEKLKADYIIMCNNDTYLLQNNFIDLVEEEYKNSKFAVLGPKIILKNDTVNSIRTNIITLKQLKKIRREKSIIYITSFFFVDKIYFSFRSFVKRLLVKLKLKEDKQINDNQYNFRHENIVLHGCFLIFSKEYIELFDGIDDRTFLYLEEDLLAIRLKKSGLKSVYLPEIVICHNEDGATNALLQNSRKKNIFVSTNWLKSSKVVLSELKELEKK